MKVLRGDQQHGKGNYILNKLMMTILEEAFEKDGYNAIPFTFNEAGHPTAVFKYNEHEITFLLDTGATINLLDTQLANKIGLTLITTEGKGGGAGGVLHDIFSIESITFRYDNLLFSFEQFFSMDFENIRQTMEATGHSANFRGIFGFGCFEMTQSYIDYVNKRIYVKNIPKADN